MINSGNSATIKTTSNMTVKELKKALENAPEDMDVIINQVNDNYAFNLAEKASIDDVVFGAEDIPRNQWATEKCFVITDQL